MAGEQWAQRVIKKHLGRPVKKHDDGSTPAMYDLRIGPITTPEVAIECIAAVDPIFAEMWNMGPVKIPARIAVKGDWIVGISATARVNTIGQNVERLLKQLETLRIRDLRVDHRLQRHDATLHEEFTSLGKDTPPATACMAAAKWISSRRASAVRSMTREPRCQHGWENSFATQIEWTCFQNSSHQERKRAMYLSLQLHMEPLGE